MSLRVSPKKFTNIPFSIQFIAAQRTKNNLQSLLLPTQAIIENPQSKCQNMKKEVFIGLTIYEA